MMPRSRSPYPAEFRQQMVELVRSRRSPDQLAREFEPSSQSIRNWVAQADRDEGRLGDGMTGVEREELGRLRRENRRLREEREILARARAWFARGTGPRRSTGSWERTRPSFTPPRWPGCSVSPERVLCVTEAEALRAGAVRRRAGAPDSGDPRAEPPDLRCAPDQGRAGRARPVGEPQTDCSPDEAGGLGGHQPAQGAAHNPARPGCPAGAEPPPLSRHRGYLLLQGCSVHETGATSTSRRAHSSKESRRATARRPSAWREASRCSQGS